MRLENRTLIVSAEVLLKSAGGKSLVKPGVLISADNVHLFKASPVTVNKARKSFEDIGFKTEGHSTGITLVGPARLFEEVFKISLSVEKAGGTGQMAVSIRGEPQIPAELKDFVEAVVFPPPPELLG